MLAKILQMVASEENKCCMHETWDDLGQQSVVTVGDAGSLGMFEDRRLLLLAGTLT